MPATIAYGPHRSQVADLWRPDAGDPVGVVVVLHGGFWRQRYDRHLMDGLSASIAARGWAAWNVEYRRVGWRAGGGWPNTAVDIAAAVDHLAELDGLDLDRVVVTGHSAGGHLAAWVGGRATHPDAPGGPPKVSVGKVASLAGVTDLDAARRLRLGNGAVDDFLGRATDAASADPVRRLPTGVPGRAVHGDDDRIVPVAVAEGWARSAQAAGDDVTLDLHAGVGHFEVIDPTHRSWTDTLDWLTA